MIWSCSPMPREKHGPRASVTTKTSAFGLGFCLLSPSDHVFTRHGRPWSNPTTYHRMVCNKGSYRAERHVTCVQHSWLSDSRPEIVNCVRSFFLANIKFHLATHINLIFTLSRHRCRRVLSFHAPARPSVRPEWSYRPKSFRVSAIDLRFGRMMHSIMKQIAI